MNAETKGSTTGQAATRQPIQRRMVRAAGEAVPTMPTSPGTAEAPPPEARPSSALPARQPAAAAPSKEKKPWEERGPWGVVVEDIVRMDVKGTYDRLVKALRLGDGPLAEPAVIRAALKDAESNAFEAGKLARFAKLEQERVDRLCNREMEILRTSARTELERERKEAKKEATKGKEASAGRITNQELDDKVMASWPDLYERLSARKDEAHAVRGTCENLYERWESRAATLRALNERA